MPYYVQTPIDTVLHNVGVSKFQNLVEAIAWAHLRWTAAEIRDDNDKIVYEFDERNQAFDTHDEWRAGNIEPEVLCDPLKFVEGFNYSIQVYTKCCSNCGKPPTAQHHCDNWNCPKLTLTRS